MKSLRVRREDWGTEGLKMGEMRRDQKKMILEKDCEKTRNYYFKDKMHNRENTK